MSKIHHGDGDRSSGPQVMTSPGRGCGSGRSSQGGGAEWRPEAGYRRHTPASRRTAWCGAWPGLARAGPAPRAATASATSVRSAAETGAGESSQM